jgi:hypothetical protein
MSFVYLAGAVFLVTALGVVFAPGFLFTEDVPSKSDAVVLFVGPGNQARRFEAEQLVKEGYARYLLIPFTGEVLVLDRAGVFRNVETHGSRIPVKVRRFYENTHIEALRGRQMMDNLGLRSALIVSSGFHMRRISLISGRVFEAGKYEIACTPAKWQEEFTAADWLDRDRRKVIVSEYAKIGWFLVYETAGL